MRGLRGKKEGTLIGTVDIGLTTRVIALPWTGETPSLVKEIVEGRKKLKLTQDELAQKMSVGIASIKRWKEQAFKAGGWNRLCVRPCMGKTRGDACTGNRTFSLPRIRLGFVELEKVLGKKLLKKNDKMLFAAKYLWYADMIAHRETGQSMTGATFAALPLGPQLNNYRELIKDIMKEDPSAAEPLTPEEKRILARIAMTFPQERMVYNAGHREQAWKGKAKGSLIPYTDSSELTAH